MKLTLCIATMRPREGIVPDTVMSLVQTATQRDDMPVLWHWNTPEHNDGVVGSYNAMYRESTQYPYADSEILAYIHDDVWIREEGWDERVLKEFEDPTIGVVGFGGARHHGSPDLYKIPYKLQQLARFDYYSNVDDAETHGTRFADVCDVAVLDGFSVIVRRELLDRAGGWPNIPGGFHNYDYAICGLAHRFNYRVRCIGIRCHHEGGKTSTTPQYQEWAAREKGMTDQAIHEASHEWFYDEFRDVMPWSCQ